MVISQRTKFFHLLQQTVELVSIFLLFPAVIMIFSNGIFGFLGTSSLDWDSIVLRQSCSSLYSLCSLLRKLKGF